MHRCDSRIQSTSVLLILAVVFFVYRTEARSKALGMNEQGLAKTDQAIIGLLNYNLQQGILKIDPQAQVQPAAPAPEKKEPAKKAEK